MIHLLLLYGANLGEFKGMGKGNIEKKHGVSVARFKGHHHYRWRVNFREGGELRRLGFKTKALADDFAKKKRQSAVEEGTRLSSITDSEKRAVMEFRDLVDALPSSVQKPTLAEVIRDFEKRSQIRRKSQTIQEVADKLEISMEGENLSEVHKAATRRRIQSFCEVYGGWLACDVSEDIIGDWLHDLGFAQLTVNHYRASLSLLFNHALRIKAVESNPVELVKKLKVGERDVGILTIEQASNLLAHAPDEVLPALAIGLFGGLRRAEISRLNWEEVDFDQGHIEVKAKNAKSSSRRLVPMRDNLRAWLLPVREMKGQVMPSEQVYRARLVEAKASAGIKDWPHNALRHSFSSYHLAAFKNAPALAVEMGHSNTKMIFEHYRALVTQAKGEEYWEISPSVDKSEILSIVR